MNGTFSSLLSSISGEPAPQSNAQDVPRQRTPQTTNVPRLPLPPHAPAPTNRFQTSTPSGSAVKRKHDSISETSLPPPSKTVTNNVSTQPRPSTPSQQPLPGQPVRPGSSQRIAPAAAYSAAQGTKEPSKNSYQALLQRAAAAKPATFGEIKHKAVEKPIKQRRSQTPELREKANGPTRGTPAAAASTSRVQGRRGGPGRVMEKPAKPRRDPLKLEYKGTMRPKDVEPLNKVGSPSSAAGPGRPRPSPASSSRSLDRPALKPFMGRHAPSSRLRYAAYSDEEEGAEEDYDEDDDEDDSIEGGGFDELMAEEEASLRAARKEDDEAVKQETEHRRQKTERKMALEKLAAARRKKNG